MDPSLSPSAAALIMTATPTNSVVDDDEWLLVSNKEECIQHCPQLAIHPPDDEPWVGGLVPAEEFDSDTSSWAHIRHLPPVHAMKNSTDAQHYLVSVASACVDSLSRIGCTSVNGFSSSPACSCVWEPSHGEVRVHGETTAGHMAQKHLAANAIKGILGHARGLGRFFQRVTEGWVFLAVQWTILMQDIMAAPPEIADRFLLVCLFAVLRQLSTMRPQPLDACETILQWNRESWLQRLGDYSNNRIEELTKQTSPFSDGARGEEMHKISLSRVIFELAGGRRDDGQHEVNERRTVNDNVGILRDLFQLASLIANEPLRLPSPKTIHPTELLLKHRPFQCSAEDVTELQQRIHLHIPIGFSVETYDLLPAFFIDNIGYQAATVALQNVQDFLRFDDGANDPTDSALTNDSASDDGASISSEHTYFTDLSGTSEQQ